MSVVYVRGKVPSTTAKEEVGQILDSITSKSVSNSNDNSRSSHNESITHDEKKE